MFTASPEQATHPRQTIIEFNEVVIQGEIVRPEGSVVNARRRTRFRPLVQPRTDFRAELVRSIDRL